jgi:hypothetical protein
MPKWKIVMPDNGGSGINIEKTVINQPYYYMDRMQEIINQGPAQSQSVFNFYSNDYIPTNSEDFAAKKYKAPEVQIQTDGFFPRYHNYVGRMLESREINYITNPYGIGVSRTVYNSIKEYGYSLENNALKYYLDMGEYYSLAEDILKKETGKTLDDALHQNNPQLSDAIKEKVTQALVDKIDKDFLGGAMPQEMNQFLVSSFKARLGYPRMSSIKEFHYTYLKRMIHLVVTSDAYMVE